MGKAIVRWRALNIIVFVVLLAFSAYGLQFVRSDTNQENYFMEGDNLLKVRDHFQAIFGNDDYCGLLVQADDVFDPEILGLMRKLGKTLLDEVPYTDDVLSLTDLEYINGSDKELSIGNLVPDDIPQDLESREKMRAMAMAKPAIKNKLVTEDSKSAWIMLRLKPLPHDGKNEKGVGFDQVIGDKVNEIAGRPEYRPLHIKTSGLPVINADKRAFVASEMPKLFGFSLLLTLAMLAVSLRSVRGVVFPFACAVFGLVLVFGVQGYLGIVNDPSMIFLPVFLCLAMALSYSIYYVNDWKEEFSITGLRKESTVHAVGRSAWPIGFSAATTMVGMLSFCFVPLKPVRWMGLTSAALLIVLYVLTIVLLPTFISYGRDRPMAALKTLEPGIVDRCMQYLGRNVLKCGNVSLLLCLIVFAGSIYGLTKVNISFDVRDSSGMDVPYVKRICEVADNPLGSLYAYGVGIEFKHQDEAKSPENLKKLEQFVKEIESFELTKRVSSIIDILKDLNKTLNVEKKEEYRIPEDQNVIAQELLLYENSGGTEASRWMDFEYSRLRLLVQMGDYKSGEAAREIRQIYRRGKELFPDADILMTGAIAQFSVMQDYVSWGQVQSFALSIVVIALLMGIAFGSLKIGLISMIPNIAPALLTGACMGYFSYPLDLLTVTVMPMLLGLAVDDTIHFVNSCKYWFHKTGSYAEAVYRTYVQDGKSMLQTTIILTLCFLTYLISVVLVFQRMGKLVAIGSLAALAADYFITPVLIAKLKVFGPEFKPDRKRV